MQPQPNCLFVLINIFVCACFVLISVIFAEMASTLRFFLKNKAEKQVSPFWLIYFLRAHYVFARFPRFALRKFQFF
jgi:hypothetical protein